MAGRRRPRRPGHRPAAALDARHPGGPAATAPRSAATARCCSTWRPSRSWTRTCWRPASSRRSPPSCGAGSPTPGSPSSTGWSSGTSRSTSRAGTSTSRASRRRRWRRWWPRRWPSCWPGTRRCPATSSSRWSRTSSATSRRSPTPPATPSPRSPRAGVTKASGLAKVAARHGIGPEDVVVFGDMPNDIAAFEWVRDGGGRAVAMAHAHPDLLAVATDVTGTNDDDGVAGLPRRALRRAGPVGSGLTIRSPASESECDGAP